MFGRSPMRLQGTAYASPGEVIEKFRTLILDRGGEIRETCDNVTIYEIPAHRIMGRGYGFGTWYGYVPLRLKVAVTPSNGDRKSLTEIECDITQIRRRFQIVFYVISIIVVGLLLIGRLEMGPGWLFVLGLPYVICEGNFLSFRMYLPFRLRTLFGQVMEWYPS